MPETMSDPTSIEGWQKSTDIHPIHQSCLGCFFAEVEDKTQTGCRLGRLEVFGEQGRVLSAYDADGNEFEIINGRLCNAYRPEWWGEQLSYKLQFEEIRNEIQVRPTVIVLIGGDLDYLKLESSIQSLLDQTKAPEELLFVNCQNDIPTRSLLGGIATFIRDEVAWRLVDALPNERGVRPQAGAAINEAFSKIKTPFYCVVETGGTLPRNFIEQLDATLNERLEQVVVVAPYAGQGLTGLVVQTSFHKNRNVGGFAALQVEGHGLIGEQLGPEDMLPRKDTFLLTDIVSKARLLAGPEAEGLVKEADQLCPRK